MSCPPVCAVVAVCKGTGGIGFRGGLPWAGKLPQELKHFSRITSSTTDPSKQNAVVMGRKTWNSIPQNRRPLPRRMNIVISQTMAEGALPDGVKLARSFEQALELASSAGGGDPNGEGKVERVMVIGGSQVYAEALDHPQMEFLYLTEVLSEFECDTFVKVDEARFAEVEDPNVSKDDQEENGIRYRFRVLKKIRKD